MVVWVTAILIGVLLPRADAFNLPVVEPIPRGLRNIPDQGANAMSQPRIEPGYLQVGLLSE